MRRTAYAFQLLAAACGGALLLGSAAAAAAVAAASSLSASTRWPHFLTARLRQNTSSLVRDWRTGDGVCRGGRCVRLVATCDHRSVVPHKAAAVIAALQQQKGAKCCSAQHDQGSAPVAFALATTSISLTFAGGAYREHVSDSHTLQDLQQHILRCPRQHLDRGLGSTVVTLLGLSMRPHERWGCGSRSRRQRGKLRGGGTCPRCEIAAVRARSARCFYIVSTPTIDRQG